MLINLYSPITFFSNPNTSYSIKWRFTFMEMVFPGNIDPMESWDAYLEEIKKEAGSDKPVFTFPNDCLTEAIEVMKQRVSFFKLPVPEYSHADFEGYRFWELSLDELDMDEDNQIMVYDYCPFAPLLDWLQSVKPRNFWGSDWHVSAFLLGEDDRMHSSMMSMDASGTIHSTNSMNTMPDGTLMISKEEPGYWRAKA